MYNAKEVAGIYEEFCSETGVLQPPSWETKFTWEIRGKSAKIQV